MNDLVSIIIPTYNRATLIGETLESIRQQQHPHWECLVVDDGSTDQTEEVVKRWQSQDLRFRYIRRPDRLPKGGNACRNFGLDQSNGNFVLWFDSDDVMMPDKIARQLDLLKDHPKAAASIGQSYYYNFDTQRRVMPWREQLHSDEMLHDFILQRAGWCTNDALWRKELLGELRWNEALQSSQDYEFHARALILQKPFVYLEECLTHVRWTPGSIKVVHNHEKTRSAFLARRSIFQQLRQSGVEDRELYKHLEEQFYLYLDAFGVRKDWPYVQQCIGTLSQISQHRKRYGWFLKQLFWVYPRKIVSKRFQK